MSVISIESAYQIETEPSKICWTYYFKLHIKINDFCHKNGHINLFTPTHWFNDNFVECDNLTLIYTHFESRMLVWQKKSKNCKYCVIFK